jgi:hypothetical protein
VKEINFALGSIAFILRRDLYNAEHSCDMGSRFFFSSEVRHAADFYRPLISIALRRVLTREPWSNGKLSNR